MNAIPMFKSVRAPVAVRKTLAQLELEEERARLEYKRQAARHNSQAAARAHRVWVVAKAALCARGGYHAKD